MRAPEAGMATPFWYSIGTQYPDASAPALHVVPWPTSDCAVEAALVVWFPKNWCTWDMPGMFGWTIGSSGSTWLDPHRTRKVVTPPPPALPASAGPPGPLEALPPLGPTGGPGLWPPMGGGPHAAIATSAAATIDVTATMD